MIYEKRETFNNTSDGGIIKARSVLDKIKEVNKPFLDKHPEYCEDYDFEIGEISTTLIYKVEKIKEDGSEKSGGDI